MEVSRIFMASYFHGGIEIKNVKKLIRIEMFDDSNNLHGYHLHESTDSQDVSTSTHWKFSLTLQRVRNQNWK